MAEKIRSNWRTSVAGGLLMVMGAWQLYHGDSSGAATVTTGAGLLAAKDGL